MRYLKCLGVVFLLVLLWYGEGLLYHYVNIGEISWYWNLFYGIICGVIFGLIAVKVSE